MTQIAALQQKSLGNWRAWSYIGGMTALIDRPLVIEPAAEPLAQPHLSAPERAATSTAPFMLPIRSLGPAYRQRIARHLLALSPEDRYLRFGYSAGDEQIQRYVDQLDFDRDDILGIHNRRLELIATAHLAYTSTEEHPECAEFAVSVLPYARGRGYGGRLFERAAIYAQNEGVHVLFIHALSENTAMLNIARSAGAVVRRDGSESQAFLELPAATFDSRLTEAVHEQFAAFDYQLKKQARQFSAMLSGLQVERSQSVAPDQKTGT